MQNTFSQSGNDSKWFLIKIIFQNRYVALETPSRPPRDPPPFMANAILNFPFDFPHTSLIHLTQCNGLRNVDFLFLFFYVCWIVVLAKTNNRLIMILTVRQTSKEAKDKALPKHFCDPHCEREDDSQY